MKKTLHRLLCAAFAMLALAPVARADRSVTYTVTMPHYYQDGQQMVGTPNFVVHGINWTKFTSGKYEAFETAVYPRNDYFKCKDLAEGYYAAKWEVLTSGGKPLFSTEDEMANVQFLYSWYDEYGDSQLRLIVSIAQKQYTVLYDANGGDWNGAEPEPKSYDYNKGGSALPRTAAVREGHALSGWNTMPDGSGTAVGFSEAFTGKTFGITAKANDIVLYAQWKAKPYAATIAAGEGGSGAGKVSYSYSEIQQTKVIALPTREGHSIAGWTATDYSGSAPAIQGNTLTIPAKTSGNFTMTPTWKANTYTLRVEKGVGIAQISVDYVRDGTARHDATSYGTTYSVDYGTAWSAYAVAAEGYSTNATCMASGTMTAAGAVFSPTASCNDYNLRLSLGEGIATIWYRVGVSSEWSWTTNNVVVPVAFNATWQAYAEAAEGYSYTGTGRERPASGTMTTGGASFEPVGTLNQYPLSLELGPGIVKIYCDYTNKNLYCHGEFTSDKTVSVDFGTWWHARGVVADYGETNQTCEASRRMGSGGDRFAPTATLAPQPLTLTKGAGIAEIYYRTNGVAWIAAKGKDETVYVMYDATWSAYAEASPGYAYSKTSKEHPYTARMAAGGDVFAPTAAPNTIWVRYDRNGGGDAGQMDDSEFTYDVEAPLRRNSYARSYEIHYNGNGGTCAHESDVSGYAFTDWRDTAEGLTGAGHYSYSDGVRVKNPCGSTGALANDPVILYAQWKPKSVTLPLPVRAGYDFSGWYTLREGGQRVGGAGETYAATDNITLFAHWRAHVTRLRFVVGGEEVPDYAHAVANGEKYGDFGSLPELTNDDPKKLFLGWYTAPESGMRISDSATVDLTGDTVILYAQWETVTYTITYETNGGTISEYAKTGYNKGQSFALPTAVTRTDGRIFLGWYDNPTFEGEAVERIASTDSGDKTFYAKWSEASTDKVTLTFVNVSSYSYYSNSISFGWTTVTNAATPLLTQTYAKGAKVMLPGALFFQEGGAQAGWRQAGDKKTNPNTWATYELGDGLGAVTQDRTYHTIWAVNTYTIVYDGNGDDVGGIAYDRNIRYGDERKIYTREEAGMYKTGYDFVGWAMNKGGHAVYQAGEKVSNLTAQAGGVVTLYAVWKEKSVPSVKSAPKQMAAPSVASSPAPIVTPEPSAISTFATSQPAQPSYTLHFSPGADVVNPQAMTNWENCVSGEAITPDCLYTNVYSDGFIGWIYNGETNTTIAPVPTFDGQVVSVQAAWKEYEPGLYSDAVGLKNVMLTCRPGSEWAVQTTGGVDKGKPSCLLADSNKDRVLSMQVNGPGRITYYWRYDTAGGIASNVVDGVATAIVSSKSWEEKTLDIAGDSSHLITWFVPAEQPVNLPSFFIDKVRWEPTPRQYAITTAAEPEAGGSTTGDGSYAAGETATLVATPADGYLFVQWNDGSTDQAHKVMVWGDITNYVATFRAKTCTVTGDAVPPEGGSVVGGGTYAVGTKVTLVAQPTDEHWAFTQWTDGVATPSRQITVSTDATYTALFTNQYEITGVAIPSEGGTVTGGGRYKVGEAATLTAVPANDDWTFVKWSDDYPSAGRSFTVAKDATYEALFTNQYLVTVSAMPAAAGTVTGGGRYVIGATAVLSATANAGYTFERWSDGSTDVNHMVTVLCATNLTATFSGSGPTPPGPTYYYVDFDGNGATGGTMAEQSNVCGTNAVLCSNAFVRTGYVFDHWLSVAGKTSGSTYTNCATVSKDLANTNCAALLKAIWKATEYRIDFDENGGRGEMESVLHCSYGISYQLPDCTFTRDKETFAGWATDPAGSVVYKDGVIVRDLSVTGGVVTLYAVWSGHGTKEVNIAGHTATKHYTGRPFTVSGYDVEILSEGYYTKDFTIKPGTVTTITATDVKYDAWGNVAKYAMGLTADSFVNLVPSVEVLFNVEDGWLKILPSRIGGEPKTAAGSQLSAFDGEGVYGKPFDGSAISNAYAQAGYGVTQVEYAALEAGPWSTNAPVMTVVGATSIWYRVLATGYEPYAHELSAKVKPRYVSEATVAPIPDQEWTGTAVTPEPEVTAEGETLVKDADYYLTYANNTDPGEATVIMHGIGNWQGTATANFRIVRTRNLEEDAAIASISDQAWTGQPVEPKVAVTVKGEGTALAEGTDYNLTYRDNINQGVATVDVIGTNSWRGTISATFRIIREISGEPGSGVVPPGGLSKFDATAEYDGQPHTVDAGALLKAYADVYAGAQVTFGATAQGSWGVDPVAITDAGTTSFWYRVTASYCTTFTHEAKVTVTPRDLAKATVASISDQTWTGKPIEPPVTVTDGRPSIITAGDYDVAYSDNVDLGTATVTLTGKRNYTDTKTAQFKIVEKVRKPTRVTITGHVATNAYDGKAHAASGFDFVSTHAGYTRADFRCTAWTSVTRTELGTTFANLTAADFENLNDDFTADFVVARDISVTVTTGTIPGEPGPGKVPAGGNSKYDATYVYDGAAHTLNAEALTNAFAAAYVVTNVAYAATAGGPWLAEPPAISDAGATSFWYRVSCENYEPFTHQAKVTVTPCATVVVSITGHVATNVYDGLAHRVEGYDVSIAGSALYTEDDFAFSGRDYAERTKPGVTRYEMKVADFRNVNGNFKDVTFVVVRDGESAVVWDEPPAGVGEVGRYYGYTLVELGYDVTDAVSVKIDGLPAGLTLKKANVNGYWYVEGIPTATASTNDGQCAYLRITRKVGTAKVEEIVELPIEVREARVREIDPPAVLDKAYGPTPIDELWPEVEEAVTTASKDWSFTGWPTGIKYTTRDVRGQADAYEVYGKAVKAGVFTVTATRTVVSLFTTARYKEKYYASFMTEPEEGEGVAYVNQAYLTIKPVGWTDVKSVSGLPTGLKYGLVKGGVEVYGTPTKAGCFVVTRTYADRTKDTILWQVLPGENGGATVDFGGSKVEQGVVQVELGLYVWWPLAAAEGAKVTVSGLPTGLTYKGGEIRGVLTRAGNYVATVKTVANGVTVTQRFAVKANALPAYLVGTYYGAATNGLGTAEQFTLMLAATGKVSGNFYVQGKRVSFSAASLERHEADGCYVATVMYKYGGETYTDELVLATTNAVEGVDLWQVSLRTADGVLVGVDARRDVVKEVYGKLEAKTYPIEDETFAEGEFLNAKVATSGAVTVSGSLLDANGKKVAVSCSTRLAVLDEDRLGCWITIYKTVSRQPPITYVRFWELEY